MQKLRRWAILALVVVTLLGLGVAQHQWRLSRDRQAIRTLVGLLSSSGLDAEKGYWVGDVSGLYILGEVPKEVAEADLRPMKPLTPKPKPYHGYFVVAMESAPGASVSIESISLKGMTRNKETFGYCVFPAEGSRSSLPIHLITRSGHLQKLCDRDSPILTWPSRKELDQEWYIVD